MDIDTIHIKSRSVESVAKTLENFKMGIYPKLDQHILPSIEKLEDLTNEIDRLILVTHGRATEDPPHHQLLLNEIRDKVLLLEHARESKLAQLEQLDNDLQRQDDLCRSFAHRASLIRHGCDRISQRLNNIIESPHSDIEAIRSLQCLYFDTDAMKPFDPESHDSTDQSTGQDSEAEPIGAQMQTLENIQLELDREHVFTNAYTTESIASVRARVQSVRQSLEDQLDIHQTAEAIASPDLTRDQRNEIQSVFAHFDSDESGTLNRAELREACQALGLSDAPTEELTLDAFLDFCAGAFAQASKRINPVEVQTAFQVLGTDDAVDTRVIDRYFSPHVLTIQDKGETTNMTMAQFMKKNMVVIPAESTEHQPEHQPNDKVPEEKRRYRDFVTSLFNH